MNNLEDSYKAKGLRRQLVKEIEGKGIKSATVLSAIGKMPRHVFFDSIFLEHLIMYMGVLCSQNSTF